MNKQLKYKIPDEYFFRLHHVRPRYKDDVEEALLYVVTSIAELDSFEKKEYRTVLNSKLREFKNNRKLEEKTIDNWRTEISAIFALIDFAVCVLL